jgi:hypothetical protein
VGTGSATALIETISAVTCSLQWQRCSAPVRSVVKPFECWNLFGASLESSALTLHKCGWLLGQHDGFSLSVLKADSLGAGVAMTVMATLPFPGQWPTVVKEMAHKLAHDVCNELLLFCAGPVLQNKVWFETGSQNRHLALRTLHVFLCVREVFFRSSP